MCVPVGTVLESRRVVHRENTGCDNCHCGSRNGGGERQGERQRERQRERKTERKKERERLEAKRLSVNVMRNNWPLVTHKWSARKEKDGHSHGFDVQHHSQVRLLRVRSCL